MFPTRYTTRTEAIQHLIIDPIESSGVAHAEDFDIDAIADKTLVYRDAGTTRAGFEDAVDTETFWEIVQRHAR